MTRGEKKRRAKQRMIRQHKAMIIGLERKKAMHEVLGLSTGDINVEIHDLNYEIKRLQTAHIKLRPLFKIDWSKYKHIPLHDDAIDAKNYAVQTALYRQYLLGNWDNEPKAQETQRQAEKAATYARAYQGSQERIANAQGVGRRPHFAIFDDCRYGAQIQRPQT